MNSRLEKITENNKTFLIYKINEEDTIDKMSVNMLKGNDIIHILPVSFTQIGEDQYLRYDVTSKITLSDAIKQPISKERFLAIYEGVFSGILNLDDYMIPNNTLLLDIDNIYFDEFKECIYLISFPVNVNDSYNVDFAEFTRSLANRVQLQANDEFITGKILNHLNQTQTFSVVEFKKFVKTLLNEKSVPVQQPNKQPTQLYVTPPAKTPQQQIINQSLPNQQQPVNPVPRTNGAQPTQSQKTPTPIPQQRGGMNIPGKANGQMNIPGQVPTKKQNVVSPAQQTQPNTPPSDPDEPQISLFYLLQHYNAENAALYKKQKKAKKNGSSTKANKKGGAMAVPNQNQQAQPIVQSQSQVPYVEQREPQKRNFGNTTVLNGKNKKKTTVLNGKVAPTQNAQKRATLLRERTNERIVITKIPFKIGASEDGDVDYTLKGNTNISQFHATIGYEVSGYTIADNNSTNGTFLNANPITPGQYMLLNTGDYIRMADEDFRFELI